MQIQTEVVVTFLIVSEAYMNILFIIKLKVLSHSLNGHITPLPNHVDYHTLTMQCNLFQIHVVLVFVLGITPSHKGTTQTYVSS